MVQPKVNAFGKLGRLITKRKFTIIAVWLLLLAIILPIVLMASGVTSLTMNSSTDTNIESEKAGKIITAQFQKSVSNDSLIIIISADNVSSISTQQFIDSLITQIKSNSSITGLENVTSVYSILIPALNQTNQGVYVAYDNGNLTYNLLYSVPTIYSNVWYQAYNQTKNGNLVPGLNQTNQGVYTTIENANLTYNMLYSVPAIYLNVWSQIYSQTQDINQSNEMAYQQTADTLSQADPASYAAYIAPLLDAFNATWVLSFQDPSTQPLTPDVRASLASNITNQQYIDNFLGTNASEKTFVSALTSTFSLSSFLTNSQDQNNAQLRDFSIQFVANQSGASTSFVSAAYNLGNKPSSSALSTLADRVIWYSSSYNMSSFISMFNGLSYDQTKNILKAADESSFNDYTSHLLDMFNASWSQRVPSQPSQNWINQTASSSGRCCQPAIH